MSAKNPKGSQRHIVRLASPFMEIFGMSRALAIAAVAGCAVLIVGAVFWFFHSAPPHTLTIASGAPNSVLYATAQHYAEIMGQKGITLKVLPSQGSLENLELLSAPNSKVDVGFVQGGVTNARMKTAKLVSLGSITYQPLLVFYRSQTPVRLLSDFAGKRIAIGPDGSGTHTLALQLFALNDIHPGGSTVLTNLDAETAAAALVKGDIDVAFLMGDSASTNVMRQLIRSTNIQLFDFTQADGYIRRITYLSKLSLPQGSINFGQNIPAHDVQLLGPTVEIIAHADLAPALSDMLIEAASEWDKTRPPQLFSRRGEFPTPLERDIPISSDATRYYTSGKKGFYRWLPFSLASLVSRIAVSFLPLIVVLIPALKLIPAAFRWRMRMRINRWYRELLAVEKNLVNGSSTAHLKLMTELENIEDQVNKMKVPASFADQFYGLRGHIQFVREQFPEKAA